jgi:glycosyltransferase involved in cell wall biosynthesis
MHLRVLSLDSEGGYGGSSRSLFQLLSYLPKEEIHLEVWCRRKGPIQEAYRRMGIPCRVEGRIIASSALLRLNVIALGQLILQFMVGVPFLIRLLRHARKFDIIHINLESMFLVLCVLRFAAPAKLVMHIRTLISKTWYGRLQARLISKTAHHVIFITENERVRFTELGGCVAGTVLYNVIDTPDGARSTDKRIVRRPGLLVALSLGRYEWVRGVDRLLEVARVLAEKGVREVLFVVAGNVRLPRFRSAEMVRLLGKAKSLEELVVMRGLMSYFHFLGHVTNPLEVISSCDVVVQLSREPAPWSRAILESLSVGVPVVATGTYDRFVKHGETGFLYPVFDAKAVADNLIMLARDPSLRRNMGAAGRDIVKRLCRGHNQAARLVSIYRSLFVKNCDFGL